MAGSARLHREVVGQEALNCDPLGVDFGHAHYCDVWNIRVVPLLLV